MKPWIGPSLVLAVSCSLMGCVEELEPPRYAMLAPAERARPAEGTVEVRYEAARVVPAVEVEELQGGSRPRLSRTLRLGAEAASYDTGARAQPPSSASSNVTVIVNNTITQQQTMVGGGYGAGGGYAPRGGYAPAGYGTYARPTYGASPSISAPYQPQAPQGAPPVGGNWAPPRNFGPPAMR